jgi:hypothetical protein
LLIGIFLFFLPILLIFFFFYLVCWCLMNVVVSIWSIFFFFDFFRFSSIFSLCNITYPGFFHVVTAKNNADLDQSLGVPIVIALEINIQSKPGHKSSIDFFPGINNNAWNWVVWANILFLKCVSCSSICDAKWNIFKCTTVFFTCNFYRWNGDPCWFIFYPWRTTVGWKIYYNILWELII